MPVNWTNEAYKSAVSLLTEGLKTLALINGGAAIAVLTYLGNLVSRQTTVSAPLPNLRPALLWYCGGLLATAFSFLTGYLTQIRIGQEIQGEAKKNWPLSPPSPQ